MARRKAVDPFDELLKSRYSPVGQFRPMCGYLHADGTVSQYATEAMAWYSFDRAISTCFGSAAKRLRGLHQIGAIPSRRLDEGRIVRLAAAPKRDAPPRAHRSANYNWRLHEKRFPRPTLALPRAQP